MQTLHPAWPFSGGFSFSFRIPFLLLQKVPRSSSHDISLTFLSSLSPHAPPCYLPPSSQEEPLYYLTHHDTSPPRQAQRGGRRPPKETPGEGQRRNRRRAGSLPLASRSPTFFFGRQSPLPQAASYEDMCLHSTGDQQQHYHRGTAQDSKDLGDNSDLTVPTTPPSVTKPSALWHAPTLIALALPAQVLDPFSLLRTRVS